MGMLDKVKQFLAGSDLPEETREQFAKAVNYRELLEALDSVCTANEVKLRELEREISRLEAVERDETGRLKDDGVTDRQKKLILQRIQRIRRQIQTYDDKIDIHTKNIELHQNLMGRIQRIESMSLQAVNDELISEVVNDFEEQFTRYKSVLHTGVAAEPATLSPLSTKDRAELKKLEDELLGKKATERQKPDAEVELNGHSHHEPLLRKDREPEPERERELEAE